MVEALEVFWSNPSILVDEELVDLIGCGSGLLYVNF